MRVARGFDVLGRVAEMPPSGCTSAARRRLWAQAVDLVREENLIDPAYCYTIVSLDSPASHGDQVLKVGGGALAAPRLIPETGQLTALAFNVVTIGRQVEARISSLFAERRAALAVMLDELSNLLLFDVARRAGDRIQADVRRRNLSMAGELHAGDPGLDLAAQAMVLKLAQARCVNVDLSSGQLLRPMKSGSVVYGVGIDLPPATWSRCEECPSRRKCQFKDDGENAPVGLDTHGAMG